jgi:hypothetical protein
MTPWIDKGHQRNLHKRGDTWTEEHGSEGQSTWERNMCKDVDLWATLEILKEIPQIIEGQRTGVQLTVAESNFKSTNN